MAYNLDLYENGNLKNATTVVVRVPLLGVKQKPHKTPINFWIQSTRYTQLICDVVLYFRKLVKTWSILLWFS